MSYFRDLTSQLDSIRALLRKEDVWCILINADPDALASALALRKIIRSKVADVLIAHVNSITRPDNLAMIRYLRIPAQPWSEDIRQKATRFALVDSQPSHHPLFADIPFSIIIDHHPLAEAKKACPKMAMPQEMPLHAETADAGQKEMDIPPEGNPRADAQRDAKNCSIGGREEPPCAESGKAELPDAGGSRKRVCPCAKAEAAPFVDIQPEYGAVSSMMVEYLITAFINPGPFLATALQYGIRTDTGSFGRKCTDMDFWAYQVLVRFADPVILSRILRSEYLPEWLPYFTRAFETNRHCGQGRFSWIGEVETADLLVVLADFFLKVHGLRWIVVCGVRKGRIVCVFRGGIGEIDMGCLASRTFGEKGSGGGHPAMARAEMQVGAVPPDPKYSLEEFVFESIRRAEKECRATKREEPAAE